MWTPHAVLQKYGVCRICFRELAYKGQIPGVKNQAEIEGRIFMVVNDPIADMLTRIRNANQMRYKEVEVPASKIKIEIARILKEEGFVSDYQIKENNVQDIIVLNLKYGQNKERVITGLKEFQNQDYEFMQKQQTYQKF